MSSLCPFLTIFIMNLIIQKCFEAIFSTLIDVQSNNFADLIREFTKSSNYQDLIQFVLTFHTSMQTVDTVGPLTVT